MYPGLARAPSGLELNREAVRQRMLEILRNEQIRKEGK
jgi:hypothetical protein